MNDQVEGAIHQDAPETTQTDNIGGAGPDDGQDRPKSAREIAMESIAAYRNDQLAADGVDIEASAPNPAPVSQQDDQLAAQLGEDDRSVSASAAQMVRVKVDGQEMDLPLSEVVKSYQKDATATRRLQEATSLLRLAEQKASEAQQNPADTSHNPNQQADSSDGEDRLGKIKQVFSKLYEGDEDGAAQEMLRLMNQGATATQNIDPATVTNQVLQQLEVRSAYSAAQADYPALFEQSERGALLGRATVERMAMKESIGIPKSQALSEAAEEVASIFGIDRAGRQNAEPQRTARDEKLARKAGMDDIHTANVPAGSPQAPLEAQNVSATIAEIAAQRLGQTLRANGRIN